MWHLGQMLLSTARTEKSWNLRKLSKMSLKETLADRKAAS
jgi:hypothetical protein